MQAARDALSVTEDERPLVLVVEDEPDLQSLLAFNLTEAGFRVISAAKGGEAFVLARERRPAVVVLDLNLPDVSGLDVCRSLRADPALRSTAVLMLTARGSEDDRLLGFDAGTDDYLVKPFHVRELVLRVRALEHRVRPVLPAPRTTLTAGGIELDPVRHRVFVDGLEVELRPLEYKLLLALLERPGRVVPRTELLQSVWHVEAGAETRTLDVTVRRLRLQLGTSAQRIETVQRVGYRLRG
jgi:two-component system, OmpR family, phosphate regulon response regulator PhoB